MKRLPLLILLIFVMSGSFLAGMWYVHQGQLQSSTDQPREVATSPAPAGTADREFSPGAVEISPERQQLIGLKTELVEKRGGSATLRALGRVAVDETRIYRITSAVDGWIVEIAPRTTGDLVRKNEILGSYYAPEYLSAQQAYLYALGAMDRFQASGKETPGQIGLSKANIQQYKDTLRNLGMGNLQIEEIARTRLYTEKIHIYSPLTGFILARNLSGGERFEKGKELYRLADLSRVWILADTYEDEASHLKPGTAVKVSLPNQNKTFEARVSTTLPQFDAATRTLKIRLEAANPQFTLRPDMFVDVEIPVTYPPALTAPADAVLDSGLKKTVFVDRGDGFFEPREVQTGRRHGDRVEITKGLAEGERIVVSGNFLVDSESRMQLSASGVYGTLAKDPVCGRDVSVRKAEREGLKTIQGGRTYYFSSMECKQKFDRDPARFAGQPPAAGGAVAPGPAGR
jgi:Cu(I)/Ag(I) efflux system membrane fusion protein